MVHACRVRSVLAEQHQTAFRGQAPVPIRDGDGRGGSATPQKPLRADEPVIQDSELDPASDGVREATRRGNRDPRAVGATRVHRVGSVRLHSAVGPHRVGNGSRGWDRSSGHRRGGQSKPVGVGQKPPW